MFEIQEVVPLADALPHAIGEDVDEHIAEMGIVQSLDIAIAPGHPFSPPMIGDVLEVAALGEGMNLS